MLTAIKKWTLARITRSKDCYPVTVFHQDGRIITDRHPVVRHGLVFVEPHGWAIREDYAPVVRHYQWVDPNGPPRFKEHRRVVHCEPPPLDRVSETEIWQQVFQEAGFGISLSDQTCGCPTLVRPHKIRRLINSPIARRWAIVLLTGLVLVTMLNRNAPLNYWGVGQWTKILLSDVITHIPQGMVPDFLIGVLASIAGGGVIVISPLLWRKMRNRKEYQYRTPRL